MALCCSNVPQGNTNWEQTGFGIDMMWRRKNRLAVKCTIVVYNNKLT